MGVVNEVGYSGDGDEALTFETIVTGLCRAATFNRACVNILLVVNVKVNGSLRVIVSRVSGSGGGIVCTMYVNTTANAY